MSIQAIAWVLEHSVSEGSDRLVLLAIANHCDARGFNAWPAVDQIAVEARVHRATVFRCIETLVALGDLEVLRSGGGRARPNQYRLPMKPSQDATLTGRKPSQDATVKDRKTVASRRENSRTRATRTVLNRKETSLERARAREAPPRPGQAKDGDESTNGQPKPKDPLVHRAASVVPGTSYTAAATIVRRLEDEGISRLLIDEAIGFALTRNDVKSIGFLQQIARDWMKQRDNSWSPQHPPNEIRSIKETIGQALRSTGAEPTGRGR